MSAWIWYGLTFAVTRSVYVWVIVNVILPFNGHAAAAVRIVGRCCTRRVADELRGQCLRVYRARTVAECSGRPGAAGAEQLPPMIAFVVKSFNSFVFTVHRAA